MLRVSLRRRWALLLGLSALTAGCVSESVGRPECLPQVVLESADLPCHCQGEVVGEGDLETECSCGDAGFECADPADCELLLVSDASDVWDALPEFAAMSGLLPITVDLVAATALELHAETLCTGWSECEPATFSEATLPEGMHFSQEDPLYGSWYHQVLHVDEGVRFRLRVYVEDVHPWSPPYVPSLKVVSPCTKPCEPGTSRCPGDQVCFTPNWLYCLHCLELSERVCACWTPTGPEPDGTECMVCHTDVCSNGACDRGVCDVYF